MNRVVWMALAVLFFLLTPAAGQVKGPIAIRVDVPPGKWKAVRLRNLPQDAVVALRVQASGEVMVAFLDADDYKRFPATMRPLFTGRVERQIALSLRMPARGDYFMVLDNRLGSDSRAIPVATRASGGQPNDGTKDRPLPLSIARNLEGSTSAALSGNHFEKLAILGNWRGGQLQAKIPNRQGHPAATLGTRSVKPRMRAWALSLQESEHCILGNLGVVAVQALRGSGLALTEGLSGRRLAELRPEGALQVGDLAGGTVLRPLRPATALVEVGLDPIHRGRSSGSAALGLEWLSTLGLNYDGVLSGQLCRSW